MYMNRFKIFFMNSLPNKKTICYIILAVVIYTFADFMNYLVLTGGSKGNYYHYLISNCSNQFIIAYFTFSIYIILIHNIYMRKEFNKYIIVRFKNIKDWYNKNFVSVIVMAIIFTLFMIIIFTIEASLTLDFTHEWSEYYHSIVESNLTSLEEKQKN